MDSYLTKYAVRYDQWLGKDKMKYSSKVIPIHQSLEARQWVMPTQQAISIIARADSFALTPCACRTHYQCDKPKEVCFLLNDVAQKAVEQKAARKIDFNEAEQVLHTAAEAGLVHLSLYRPDQKVFALCNCCSCCCHDLQLLIKHHRTELVMHSDFIAATNETLCTGCGFCTENCPFKARDLTDQGRIAFNPQLCYGCGVCIPICPENAIEMKERHKLPTL
ncbi:MAG: 4Fe-4S dicluster domain-containing protein [Desulfobacter sp.]|nr:4Fe-4S dicluster domain-containing protein [Desulfobacter sp.]